MFFKALVLAMFIAIAALAPIAGDAEEAFGHFMSSAKVESAERGSGEGGKLRLLEDLAYIEQNGDIYIAEKGFASDGSSIPRAFWPFVGEPLESSYRSAAIIHDWYCEKKTRAWPSVHRMLYRSVRAAGLGELHAKRVYAAVMFGGPRWGLWKLNCSKSCHQQKGVIEKNGLSVFTPRVSNAKIQQIVDWVDKQNPSLDEIDMRANERHGMSESDLQ